MPAIAAIWAVLSKLPWKWIGIGIAVLGLATLIYRAPWAESRQKAKDYAHFQPILARDLQNITTLKNNQAVLQASIDLQNAAVSALKVEGDKRVSDGKTALEAAQRANAGLSQQADALRKSATRKPGVNDPCTISDTLKTVGSI